MSKKLLVIDCAAFGWNIQEKYRLSVDGLTFQAMDSTFPGLTCCAQAAFRTASPASEHGMVANGCYFPDLAKSMFWEQSAKLVKGERIWKEARARGKKVGMMFWQQSLGEEVDLLVSPKPVHKHSGGLIQDCYTQPPELFDELNTAIKKPFSLFNYWGPTANHKSSDWICAAVKEVLVRDDAPDILFTYIPHLDYDVQRFGPDHPKAKPAAALLNDYLSQIKAVADAQGYDVLVFGDYAIRNTSGSVLFPNKLLRKMGLLKTRKTAGMQYLDYFSSKAFAMVDHEVAHIYCDEENRAKIVAEFSKQEGIEHVLYGEGLTDWGIDHASAGQIVLIGKAGTWFAYPWWNKDEKEPDFASHVDIHNKPGFDPCELFFGPVNLKEWPPVSISQNVQKVGGSHGAVDKVAWAFTSELDKEPETFVELAEQIKRWINQHIA